MSHFTKVKNVKFKNVETLKQACKALGLELKEGGFIRGYQGLLKVDYHVPLKSFDLGFVLENGELVPIADFWLKETKETLEKLKNEYIVQHIKTTAMRKGYSLIREFEQEGAKYLIYYAPEGGTIHFEIKNGEYTINVNGVTGKVCVELTREFEIGDTMRTYKPEYLKEKQRLFCG